VPTWSSKGNKGRGAGAACRLNRNHITLAGCENFERGVYIQCVHGCRENFGDTIDDLFEPTVVHTVICRQRRLLVHVQHSACIVVVSYE